MSSKQTPETDMQPPTAERQRNDRPRLSPDISELLNMLKAFEKSLAPVAASPARAAPSPVAESIPAFADTVLTLVA